MDITSYQLVKLKRENFHIDLRKKFREVQFQSSRLNWIQQNEIPDNHTNDFDLYALQIAPLSEEGLLSQIDQEIQYILSLNNIDEWEKILESIAKLKIMSTKYLMMEEQEQRIKSSKMSHIYTLMAQKGFLQIMIQWIDISQVDNVEMVGIIFNSLWIINNLIMGNNVVTQIVKINNFVSQVILLLKSKYDLIKEQCFQLLGNLILDNDLNAINFCLNQNELVESFQYVLSCNPVAQVRDAANFCINAICTALTNCRALYDNHPLTHHIVSFIGLLIPDYLALKSLIMLLQRNLRDNNFCINIVEKFLGLFQTIIGYAQNLIIIPRASKEISIRISLILNLLNQLTFIDDELFAQQLISLGLFTMYKQVLNNCNQAEILQPICYQLSNLACSECCQDIIIKDLLTKLFELTSNGYYELRKNACLAIFNLLQTVEWEKIQFFADNNIHTIIIKVIINNDSDVHIVRSALSSLTVYLNYAKDSYSSYNNPLILQFKLMQGFEKVEQLLLKNQDEKVQEIGRQILNSYLNTQIDTE